jgi:hypothetical protein
MPGPLKPITLTDREIPSWNDDEMYEWWRPLYNYAELRLEPPPSYGPRFVGTLYP